MKHITKPVTQTFRIKATCKGAFITLMIQHRFLFFFWLDHQRLDIYIEKHWMPYPEDSRKYVPRITGCFSYTHGHFNIETWHPEKFVLQNRIDDLKEEILTDLATVKEKEHYISNFFN